jgi:hypothetical protein
MRRRRRRNDGGPPIVTIFTLGQHNPLDITNTCAHIYIHKAIESQSLWRSPIWVSHTQRVAHWILKVFAHKELPIRLLRGFFFVYRELPIRLLRVFFFCVQRIAHQTLTGFAYKELPLGHLR